jgi:hypothetical protein
MTAGHRICYSVVDLPSYERGKTCIEPIVGTGVEGRDVNTCCIQQLQPDRPPADRRLWRDLCGRKNPEPRVREDLDSARHPPRKVEDL